MKTKIYNQITSDELLQSMEQLVDEKLLTCAVITTIFTKNNADEWSYLIGKCEFSEDPEDIEEIYSDVAFIRKCVSDFDLKTFLMSMDGDGYKISEDLPPLAKSGSNDMRWTEEVVPSNVTLSEYPERKYSGRITSDATFNNEMLLGYYAGFQPSAQEYIKDFMGIEVYHGHSHADNGEFSISIPDHRGRIIFDEKIVSIESSGSNICLVGDIPNIGRIRLNEEETIEVNKTAFSKSELWLLTKENKILDYRSVIESRYQFSDSGNEQKRSEQILVIIDRGEGHRTEFKSYIDLIKDKNKKANDIEKTVCALSNASGGYLLIGVDDYACVNGVNKKLLEHYEMSIDKALDAYMKDIKKRLQEKLRYGQCFNVSQVQIGEKNIIVIWVERTEKPNYFVNTDLAYIRKGATSTKMKSTEERQKENMPLSFLQTTG